MLKNLFGVTIADPRPAPTLERLIVLWSNIEKAFKERLKKEGIDRGPTFFWEDAMKSGVLSFEDIESLTELRMIRNKQVHSSTLDETQISYAVDRAEALLTKLPNNK